MINRSSDQEEETSDQCKQYLWLIVLCSGAVTDRKWIEMSHDVSHAKMEEEDDDLVIADWR